MGNENHPKMVNGMYGPTLFGHYYKPAYYHNARAKNPSKKGKKAKALKDNNVKTKWAIQQWEQYDVFRDADEGQWIDNIKKGLFSFRDNGNKILGENGERLAFFPTPPNKIDAWHGYPVKSKELLDDDLIVKWKGNDDLTPFVMHLLRRDI